MSARFSRPIPRQRPENRDNRGIGRDNGRKEEFRVAKELFPSDTEEFLCDAARFPCATAELLSDTEEFLCDKELLLCCMEEFLCDAAEFLCDKEDLLVAKEEHPGDLSAR